MPYQPNHIYHIYNQGNNQQYIFFQKRNYSFFINKMRQYLLPYVDILCYCLMPNHFHWMVHTKMEACMPSNAIKPRKKIQTSNNNLIQSDDYQQNLSHAIGKLLSSYTKAINKQEQRSGSLFRSHTKAKNGIIEELITINNEDTLIFKPNNPYVKICFNYIHNNPVKAHLVAKPEYWEHSSAQDYKGLRNNDLCNQQLAQKIIWQ